MAATTRTERRINGRTVRLIRKLRGLTQAQVATAAGAPPDSEKPFIDYSTVSHVEAGRQPSLAIMRHIANGLEVDLDEITYFTVVVVGADEAAEAAA